LKLYALGLENPPLLVVCDMERFRIVTNWTAAVSETHELALDDLRDPRKRRLLKWVLSDSEKLRPDLTRQALTERGGRLRRSRLQPPGARPRSAGGGPFRQPARLLHVRR
jgi:hypothetical protein